MKRILLISTFLIALQYNSSAKVLNTNKNLQEIILDTIVKSPEKEDEKIDEILKSRALPRKETIEYLSQETKYGFKNLFKNYSYNSTKPYSSQVNPYAENYMQDYLKSHTSFLQKMKATSTLKFNFIDNILAQYGLPKELKYLAVIESNLISTATSWVGARGPWQFMSYTAVGYGLRVNSFIDERTDYYKSTHAAAKYLLYLYKDLKDWLLVIAAYNGGPGRVHTAMRKSGSRNFWALQYYLPTESRNHVKKFIATHFIMEAGSNSTSGNMDYSSLNSGAKEFKQPVSKKDSINTEVLNISGKYNSVIIAKNLSMDLMEFNRLNPEFDQVIAAGKGFDLRLTAPKMEMFLAKKYLILNESIHLLLNTVNSDTNKVFSGKQTSKKK